MSISQHAGLRAGPLAFLLIGFCGGVSCSSVTGRATVSQPAATERQITNAVNAGDGDYEAKVLRSKLLADPQDLNARLELARYYQRRGFPEIAIEHCRLACEQAPESVEAHIALAKMLRADHRTVEAAKELGEFATRHDGDVEVWAWLGLLRDESGDWKAGETAHRKAVALAPDRDDLHNNLGYCLLKQGRKDDAAEEFRAALKINSQSITARDNLGLALVGNLLGNSLGKQAGSSKDAVLNWQSVSDPASAHNNMAVALIEAGNYAEARREIELALSYNQQHPAALKNLRLVSQLDGKAAEITAPARPPSRIARMRAAWGRFFGEDEDSQDNKDSGSAVASR